MMSIQVTKQHHRGHLCHQLQNNSVWDTSGVWALSALRCPGSESSLPLPIKQKEPTSPDNSSRFKKLMSKFCPFVCSLRRLLLSCDRHHLPWAEGNVCVPSAQSVRTVLCITTKQWGQADQGQALWHSHLSPRASATKLKRSSQVFMRSAKKMVKQDSGGADWWVLVKQDPGGVEWWVLSLRMQRKEGLPASEQLQLHPSTELFASPCLSSCSSHPKRGPALQRSRSSTLQLITGSTLLQGGLLGGSCHPRTRPQTHNHSTACSPVVATPLTRMPARYTLSSGSSLGLHYKSLPRWLTKISITPGLCSS